MPNNWGLPAKTVASGACNLEGRKSLHTASAIFSDEVSAYDSPDPVDQLQRVWIIGLLQLWQLRQDPGAVLWEGREQHKVPVQVWKRSRDETKVSPLSINWSRWWPAQLCSWSVTGGSDQGEKNTTSSTVGTCFSYIWEVKITGHSPARQGGWTSIWAI